MYCELVEAAARELRGQAQEEVKIGAADLDVEAFIPDDYVPDTTQKVMLYKRLAACRTDDTVTSLADELRDRFGRPPPSVTNLLATMRLRILAGCLGADHVVRAGPRLIITFERGRYPTLNSMEALNKRYGSRTEFDMGSVPEIRIHMGDLPDDAIAEEAVTMLRTATEVESISEPQSANGV